MMEVDIRSEADMDDDDPLCINVKQEVDQYDDDSDEHYSLDQPLIRNNSPEFITIKVEPPEYEEDETGNSNEEFFDQEIKEEKDIIIKIEFEEISNIKPKSDRPTHTHENVPDKLLLRASVNVIDIGVKLDSCRGYCRECKTLFPTENRINSHNLEAHPNLVSAPKSPQENLVSTRVLNKCIDTTKKKLLFNKCSKCECVDKKIGTRHKCVGVARFNCALCGLVMQRKSRYSHLMLHQNQDFSENDITIKYFDPDENTLDDRMVYKRCSQCDLVILCRGMNLIKRHKCNSKRRFNCPLCGLVILSDAKASHLMLHRDKNFSVKDLAFKYFDPVEEEVDEHLEYNRCSKCKCVTVSDGVNNIHQHRCNSTLRFKCHICGIVMAIKAKRNHLLLHQKRDFTEQDITFKYFNPVKNETSDELIYYRCSNCKCVILSKFFNNTIQHKCTSTRRFKCHLCGLVMSSDAKGTHLLLHQKKKFTEKDVTIKYFNPDKADIDKQLVYNRCSKCKYVMVGDGVSTYQHRCDSTRRYTCDVCGLVMSIQVKANHLALHQRRDFTEEDIIFNYFDPVEDKLDDLLVYNRCSKCKFVMVGSSNNNINLHKCNSIRRYKCRTCGLVMSTVSRGNHLKLHQKIDFTEKDVTFNYFDPVQHDVSEQLVYNRCSKCDYVMISDVFSNMHRHRCDSTRRSRCDICGLTMSYEAKASHSLLHKKKSFTVEDIIFNYFDPVVSK